ncbi:MAG: putative 4-hydroxybenzoate polyprenyltransferase [Leptospiraceae bacterium]|nr:putative 4-hydroxybenzoate polyprenyltransferase [Leptospiraceae bacterium]
MSIFSTMNNYGKMVKFSHTLFALPFAGLASVIAILQSSLGLNELLWKLLLILICMFTARSAAMGFNRYIDRDFDKKNPRTANREIPSGVLSPQSVLGFTILFSILFLIASFLLSPLCFYLAIPTLFIILFYSYSKRFTVFCHFILGLGIGIAPSGAWIAIKNELELIPALWSFGLMFHIAGFDILYSSQDVEIDKKLGLYSIPSKLGIPKAFLIAKVCHIIAFSLFIWAGYLANLQTFYFVFMAIIGVLFTLEHLLVTPTNLEKLPIAFFHINASISIVLFIGILLDTWKDLLQKFAG